MAVLMPNGDVRITYLPTPPPISSLAAKPAKEVEVFADLADHEVLFLRALIKQQGCGVEKLAYTVEFVKMSRLFADFSGRANDPARLFATLTRLRKSGVFRVLDYDLTYFYMRHEAQTD